jgi:hypothetical protein
MLTFDPEKHEYFWNGIKKPCVSDIIAPLRDFSAIPTAVLEVKKEWGTTVHLYLEMYDAMTLDPDETKWDERMIPIVAAWQRFKDQYDLNGKTICEERFYNEALGYAGTSDRRWPGCIVEIKTCAPNDTTGVQLAAYAAPLPYAADHRLIACFLDDKGSFKVREYNYKKYFNTFLCCHHVYQFKHGGR